MADFVQRAKTTEEMTSELVSIFNQEPIEFPDKLISKWKAMGPFNLKHVLAKDNLDLDLSLKVSTITPKKGEWVYRGQVSINAANPTGFG